MQLCTPNLTACGQETDRSGKINTFKGRGGKTENHRIVLLVGKDLQRSFIVES